MTAAANAHAIVRSPVGALTLIASGEVLAAVLWERDRPGRVRIDPGNEDDSHPVLREARRQLDDYFAGARTRFDLPLAFAGTEFQKRVWNELLLIPFGATRTYGEIAQRLGDPNSVRAVGAANGRNPLSIVAPCHRVVGASGDLVGFAGGLETKAFLLRLESRQLGFGLD